MPRVVTISGSPSVPSRSAALAGHVAALLATRGFTVDEVSVRDLPSQALLTLDTRDPAIAAALHAIERADAVLIVTPIYKAAYTGIVKAFLDLLPQFALAGKVVLPLATGGTLAHVLAIDYALRPVLAALGAQHVVNGLFVLDKTIAVSERGLAIDADIEQRLAGVIEDFVDSIGRRASARSARAGA